MYAILAAHGCAHYVFVFARVFMAIIGGFRVWKFSRAALAL